MGEAGAEAGKPPELEEQAGEQGGWAGRRGLLFYGTLGLRWAFPRCHAVESVFRVNPRWEENPNLTTSILGA